VWQATLSIPVPYTPTPYTTRGLQILIDILNTAAVTSRTFCTCEFRDFSIGVADDSVFLGYDDASVGNRIPVLQKKILP
jgi:hypothetical protein